MNCTGLTGMTTLNKSAPDYITTILDLQTAVCKCVQNSKVLDQLIEVSATTSCVSELTYCELD